MKRVVSALKWARACDRPSCIPLSGPKKGAKRRGIRYEVAFANALSSLYPEALHGQWWAFEDDSGSGYCQTDLLIVGPKAAVVFECKLTLVEQAFEQLSELYLPVVERALSLPTTGIVVTRHLRRSEKLVVGSLAEALEQSQETIPVLHWLENCPL